MRPRDDRTGDLFGHAFGNQAARERAAMERRSEPALKAAATRRSYPKYPGHKGRDTGREAADAAAPTAAKLRGEIIAHMANGIECTADECATALKRSVLSIRPRFSELATESRIIDTGARHRNESGRKAIVWRLRNEHD